MSSKTDICNLALMRIGVSKSLVNADTDTTREAVTCRLIFNEERDFVLRDFPWRWATKYVALANGTANPNPDWNFSYPYPTDALFLRRITTKNGRMEPNPPAFDQGSGVDTGGNPIQLVFTDAASGSLVYTRQIAVIANGLDTTVFTDPSFISMLGWRIGAVIGPSLSRMADVGKLCLEMYGVELKAAQERATLEAQKDTPIESDDSVVKEIVNNALLRIGVTKDSDAKAGSDVVAQARLTKVAFETERDYVLRDFPWPFATKYFTPDVIAGTPESPASDLEIDEFAAGFSVDGFEPTGAPVVSASQVNSDWIYAYLYPADCLYVRRIVSPFDVRTRSGWPIGFPSWRRLQFGGDAMWPPPFKTGGSINMGLMVRGGWHETPTALNATNTEFRLAQLPLAKSELLFIGELLLHPQQVLDDGTILGDYTIHGTDFRLKTPLAPGQRLRAFYWVQGVSISEAPVFRERPTGTIDGVNAAFTTLNPLVTGSEIVFLNEEYQEPTVHYTIAGNVLTMTIPPNGDDRLRIFYFTGAAPSVTTEVQSLETTTDEDTAIVLPSEPIEGSAMVFLGQYLQEEDEHYVMNAGTIQWLIPPPDETPFRAIWNTASDVSGVPVIFSNELTPCFEYTEKVVDPRRWDSSFRSMLAWRVAAILAPSRLNPENDPKKASMAQNAARWCLGWYAQEMSAAQRAGLNEQQVEQELEAEWVRDR